MKPVIDLLNAISGTWWTLAFHATWQAMLVGSALLTLVCIARRWPAPLRYGLLVLALLKFAFPPMLSVPTGVFSLVGLPFNLAESHPATENSFVRTRTFPIVPTSTDSPLERPALNFRTELSRPTSVDNRSPVPETHHASVLRLNWKSWLMLMHAAGCGIVVFWIVRQLAQLRALTRKSQCITDQKLCADFRDVSHELGLRHLPRLMVSAHVPAPIAFGLRRPTVLLPLTVVEKLPTAEIRTILAHELAHYRRRDLWINWLQLVLLATWWFNPVLWLLNRSIRQVREDCCDDLLLARGLTSNDAYCNVLMRAAAGLYGRSTVGATLGFADDLHPLGHRIARIMDRTIRRCPKASALGTFVLLLAGGLVLPGLRSQEVKPSNANPTTARKPSAPAALNQTAPTVVQENLLPQNAESIEQTFAKMRWVGENNFYFSEMQKLSLQMGPSAVPFLLTKLSRDASQPDNGHAAENRRKAAMALGFIGADAEKVVPQLIAALDDDTDWYFAADLGRDVRAARVCVAAAEALGRFGSKAKQAIRALIEAAKFGNPQATLALARIAPESKEVFTTVEEALNHRSRVTQLPVEGDYRMTALNAMAAVAEVNAPALPPLQAMLSDSNSTISQAAADAVVRLSRKRPSVQEGLDVILKSGTPAEQVTLAAALVKAGQKREEVFETLMAGTRSKDRDISSTALQAIAAFGSRAKDIVPLLVETIRVDKGPLRLAALQALPQVAQADPSVLPVVLDSLSSDDDQVRTAAMNSLRSFGKLARPAEPLLLEALKHSNPSVRSLAAGTLTAIGTSPGKAIPALRAALKDPNASVQTQALISLAKFEEAGRELLPLMIEWLDGNNAWAAAIAIGELGSMAEPAIPALIKTLEQSKQGAPNNAASALGKIGPKAKAAVPQLLELLTDSDVNTRITAGFSLWLIDGRTNVVGMLVDRIKSEDALSPVERPYAKWTRLFAIKRVAELGPAARAAVPALIEVSKENDDDLRSAAEEALKKITKGTD